ncbi:MAG TPA: hypothetical protein VFM18_19100 [Methanosarcina sp.]|nr:hypothetical protein [Methanosarcina sp.]
MAIYSTTSPYYGTPTWGPFLDTWAGKTIAPNVTDAVYQIDSIYNFRPDLLAYDLYKNANLWWVFAVRNPDVILDPLLDFTTGKIIYVPTKATLSSSLGV